MNAFKELGLHDDLVKAVSDLGFETPTPIQEQAIPAVINGEADLIGLAQTGTGKTAAFGLPLLQQIDAAVKDTQALIVCPTRELCLQITKDLTNFSKYLKGIRTVAVYGGASIEKQIGEVKRGAHIIVATPGRLIDLMGRKAVKLHGVNIVVLDEADEMLNMGFKEDIDNIMQSTKDDRRTWLFSATMPNEVRRIAENYMNNPKEISVGTKNQGNVNIEHVYYITTAREKYRALKRIVDFHPEIFGIVFGRTKIETQEIAEQLIKDGYNADALHGDLSQQQRDKVMGRFRDRTLQLLVATDVAARGIDVNDVERRFNDWVNSDPERIKKYADVTSNIGTAYGSLREVIVTNQYLNAALGGSRIAGISRSFKEMEDSLKSRKTLTAEEKNKYRQKADEVFEDYHPNAEKDILAAMLTLYVQNIPVEKQVPYVQEILKKFKGKTLAESCNKFAADMFAKSIYASKAKFVAFLEKPSASKIEKEPATIYVDKLLAGQKDMGDAIRSANLTIQRQSMLLIEGMREMNGNKAFYPDANGTPRLSYGKVINYSPKDAVEFDYKTTLKGVIEKEDPKNPEEFTVPAKLKQLYLANDYGMYAEDGVLPVGFISDNDITGGNSGSPVINGSGQLVGIAFDGNWEAMTGDIVFDKDLKRCINVDIRYVLFIIDKFGGAPHIVNEMTLIK